MSNVGEVYERMLAARTHECELLDIAAEMQKRWLDSRERRKQIERHYYATVEEAQRRESSKKPCGDISCMHCYAWPAALNDPALLKCKHDGESS